MNTPSESNPPSLREIANDAIRYWERCRVIYNAVLTGIVLWYFLLDWPHSKSVVSVDGVLGVFILAVLANILYCAAYVPDIFIQVSGFHSARGRLRWVLFAIGLAFASVITRFFAMGFFQHVLD